MQTVSAREFNHDVTAAKRAAVDGPVVVTDRGRPSHVLLTYSDYERLTGRGADQAEGGLGTWLREAAARSGAASVDDLDDYLPTRSDRPDVRAIDLGP